MQEINRETPFYQRNRERKIDGSQTGSNNQHRRSTSHTLTPIERKKMALSSTEKGLTARIVALEEITILLATYITSEAMTKNDLKNRAIASLSQPTTDTEKKEINDMAISLIEQWTK